MIDFCADKTSNFCISILAIFLASRNFYSGFGQFFCIQEFSLLQKFVFLGSRNFFKTENSLF